MVLPASILDLYTRRLYGVLITSTEYFSVDYSHGRGDD